MSDRKSGDFILIFTVAILVIFGIVMVFSASYYTALNNEGDAYYYLKRVIIWAIVGSILMMITSNLPYKVYNKWSLMIILIAFVLLGLVFTPLGVEINNAKRWIGIGTHFTIMPGEIAKPAVAIFAASYLSRSADRIKHFFSGVLPMYLLMGAVAALIMLQPNLSTAITVCGIIMFIMIAAGMKASHIGVTAVLGAGAIVALMIVEPYRLKRFTTFLDPFADALGDGFQVVQSLLALGSGGLTGLGLGKSIQKTLYLPEPMNDFIFSIIGEELGLVGCLLLMFAYAVLIWRGIRIALNAKDMFGTLLATGITSMIAIQVVLNIAVVTSSMPATGVSLPFVSWGGNSLAIMMACAGILVNISRNSIRD